MSPYRVPAERGEAEVHVCPAPRWAERFLCQVRHGQQWRCGECGAVWHWFTDAWYTRHPNRSLTY